MVCGSIDLNTVENDDETVSYADSPSSPVASGNSELGTKPLAVSAVCMELWHACAGPLISLPKRGNAVVYFPQGHMVNLPERPAVAYDLPPHVFCRVIDVKLHADSANEEVYAQVSLVPDQQIEQKWKEGILETEAQEEDVEGVGKSLTPHMFCKTLTASDTSTHGGFSVPRRAAEDCFPPLDYTKQRPSQELVAKDLHGIEWKFRHIYRGQPRRHLLTTGWSAFVNKKKLVSGDAVLFLRGGDGELRLGNRRASQVKSRANILSPSGFQQLSASNIAAIVNAISMRSTFIICYNPRGRSSDIILPFRKFSKSVASSFTRGMRVRIRLETEHSSEKRCSGLIIGVSDLDPVRWPGSKWKCLLVRWDDMKFNCVNRISPWEIEPSNHSMVLPNTKRSRISYPSMEPDFPISRDENQDSDFSEPPSFQKVLQGQEVFGISPPPCVGLQTPSEMGFLHAFNGPRIGIGENELNHGFQFQKVLQGQETVSILPYGRCPEINQMHKNAPTNIINGFQVLHHGNNLFTSKTNNQDSFWAASDNKHIYRGGSQTDHNKGFSDLPVPTRQYFGDNNISMHNSSCRLFGFPLNEGKVATSNHEKPTGYESKFVHCNEDQMYQPPLVVGGCTKMSNVQVVRDNLLLDIAL